VEIKEIGSRTKQPDFTYVSIGNSLRVVEIKASGHRFGNADFDRLSNYVYALRDFFSEHPDFTNHFPAGWRIELIADGVNITDRKSEDLYETFERNDEVKRMSWIEFLVRAKTAHEAFLEVSRNRSHSDD
jgi:hypothetical protein